MQSLLISQVTVTSDITSDLTVYRENIISFLIRIGKELLFDPVQSMQTVGARVKFSETPSQVIYTYSNLSKKSYCCFLDSPANVDELFQSSLVRLAKIGTTRQQVEVMSSWKLSEELV